VSEQPPTQRRWSTISHEQLARKLKVSPAILRIFIQQGYLRASLNHPVASRPQEEVAEWLSLVCGPVSLRPILPLPEVAKILDYRLVELRKLCARKGIRVYPDKLFGYMVSPRAFFSIRKVIEEESNPLRFDRQQFLNVIMAINRTGRASRAPARPFIARLEDEIKRIANMRDPQRTIVATQLWAIYNDAAIMANAIVEANRLKNNTRARASIMGMMYNLRRAIETGKKWKDVTQKMSKHNKNLIIQIAHEEFAAELERRQGKKSSPDAQDGESSACEPLHPSGMSSESSCAPS
jgi:hypothetical protein